MGFTTTLSISRISAEKAAIQAGARKENVTHILNMLFDDEDFIYVPCKIVLYDNKVEVKTGMSEIYMTLPFSVLLQDTFVYMMRGIDALVKETAKASFSDLYRAWQKQIG